MKSTIYNARKPSPIGLNRFAINKQPKAQEISSVYTTKLSMTQNFDHLKPSDTTQSMFDDALLTAVPSLKVLDTESAESILNNADKAFLESQLKAKEKMISVLLLLANANRYAAFEEIA